VVTPLRRGLTPTATPNLPYLFIFAERGLGRAAINIERKILGCSPIFRQKLK